LEFAELFDVKSKKGDFSKDKIYTYESGTANPSESLINEIAKYAGVTSEELKNKQLTREDLKINPKPKTPNATQDNEYKDKYIEALELIVKKQEALLEKVMDSLHSVSSRLAEVEKGLEGAKRNQRVMYVLQDEFQKYVLQNGTWRNPREDAQKIVTGNAAASLKKLRTEDIHL
jgi:transcriptional regulator with XRE-family HTH domain